MDIQIIPIDQSYVQVKAEPSIIAELCDYFSFFTDGYQFNNKFKYGGWDGKIRLMGMNGHLPYGLISQLQKFAGDMMYLVQVDSSLDPKPVFTAESFKTWIEAKKIYSGNDEIKPYWYQNDSILAGINQRRAILNLPTSAGKSLIQALLSDWYLDNHQDKVLVLVPTTALVDQMQADYCDYRLFQHDDLLGIRGGSAKDSKARVYVSTWQSAMKQPKSWFNQFGMLLVDECHLATGKSISDIVKKMTYCQFKIGLSGSLRDGKANLLQYVGLFGKVFKPVSTAQLMKEGQVAQMKINCLLLQHPQADCKALRGMPYPDEIKWILEHKKRNKVIIKLALKLAKKKENVLLMFKNISHGKLLYTALCKLHDNVVYVSGETKTDDRTKIKLQAEKEDGMIIVASYGVFSTGISIKKLHHAIFSHPVKSKILVLQTIGRILRKHESKDQAIVWDFIDNLAIVNNRKNAKKKFSHCNYTYKHGIERIERYVSESFEYSIGKIPL